MTRGSPLGSAPVLTSCSRHTYQGPWAGTARPWAHMGTGTGPQQGERPTVSGFLGNLQGLPAALGIGVPIMGVPARRQGAARS